MHRFNTLVGMMFALVVSSLALGQNHYFPERRNWAERAPGELGMNQAHLQEAIDFAITRESAANKDLAGTQP